MIPIHGWGSIFHGWLVDPITRLMKWGGEEAWAKRQGTIGKGKINYNIPHDLVTYLKTKTPRVRPDPWMGEGRKKT